MRFIQVSFVIVGRVAPECPHLIVVLPLRMPGQNLDTPPREASEPCWESGWPGFGPKPYKFTGFGDLHGPKPYRFIGFGDPHGPNPYKFIGFGVNP